ncbi:MAG: ABC transporter ATP-binding protein [Bacteroidota bacterium]
MKIIASDLSKRFGKEWVFKDFNFEFNANSAYAVTGANGSGKSTLLAILCGIMPPKSGQLQYFLNDQPIEGDDVYKYIGFSAPYMSIIEEFTLVEFLNFHFSFKKMIKGLSVADVIDKAYLTDAMDKPIKNFSSGMKQRVKLAQVFFSDTPVVFLDEPTSNLDVKGQEWYQNHLKGILDQGRLIIIASNEPKEYAVCQEKISLEEYK